MACGAYKYDKGSFINLNGFKMASNEGNIYMFLLISRLSGNSKEILRSLKNLLSIE
jgi:hypothetical protein